MTINAEPRGRYFEDFEIGQEVVTPARTFTSTEIVNFACLTGDFNEVHTNRVLQDHAVRRADRARSAGLRNHGRAAVRQRYQ
jgi:acyl dehydratase